MGRLKKSAHEYDGGKDQHDEGTPRTLQPVALCLGPDDGGLAAAEFFFLAGYGRYQIGLNLFFSLDETERVFTTAPISPIKFESNFITFCF